MASNVNYLNDCTGNSIFQAVADCTYDWESWLDPNGKVVWVNRAVERLTSFTVQECMAMEDYPLSIVAPEDRDRVASLIQKALDGGSGNDQEFRILRRDGERSWFAVSWQPLENGVGERLGIRMSMRDIRERKQMEEERIQYSLQLEELAQARAANIVALKKKKHRVEKLASLGAMAAKVAHEINNPMAGIKNAIRLVRDEQRILNRGAEGSSAHMLKLVDGEIDRIIMLLRQLYQLYRPNIADPVKFDVIQVLEEVIVLVATQCHPKKVLVLRDNWPREFDVVLYENEFRQILHNLLLNAWEASPEGGEIEIEVTQCREARLQIAIRDRGEGISPEVLSQIFEPFVTTKQDLGKHNTGLGLAISQSLATAIGGSIEPMATEGGGATFVVELPIDYSSLADRLESSVPVKKSSIRPSQKRGHR